MRHPIRILLIVIILSSIGGIAFSVMRAEGEASAATTTTQPSLVTNGVTANPLASSPITGAGADFLALLLNIQSIKLDSTIFSNPAYINLQDFTRPIPPDTDPGRPNPFAPLGADSASISTQVSTSNVSSLTATTATLNGTLTSGAGAATERWFEYGTTIALGAETSHKQQLNAGTFAEPITGLIPNTIYYAKAAASIEGQTVYGNQITWTTAKQATIGAH